MTAGTGAAIAWLSIREPLWPVYAFAAIAAAGLYAMLAPLLPLWPWLPRVATQRDLKLTITSLVLSGLGAADSARLQLWVKLVNLEAPTLLHDWKLAVRIGGKPVDAEHLAGAGQQPERAQIHALDEITGTTAFRGETTGLLFFVLPERSKQSLDVELLDAVLVLSVKDQDGREWNTQCEVRSLGPSEKYKPEDAQTPNRERPTSTNPTARASAIPQPHYPALQALDRRNDAATSVLREGENLYRLILEVETHLPEDLSARERTFFDLAERVEAWARQAGSTEYVPKFSSNPDDLPSLKLIVQRALDRVRAELRVT